MSVYGKTYKAFGKSLRLTEWSKLTGIDLHTLNKRLNDYGWEPERAFSQQPVNRKARVPYKGHYYSYAELSRLSEIGLSPGIIRHRIVNRGMSVFDAITQPSKKDGHTSEAFHGRKPKECTYPDCGRCPYDDCRAG